jgi:predicted ribosome quality control (RQC) complex YloA/Tae2 family protein
MKQEKITVDERNFIISIGRNAKENWDLIDKADDFDLWFHIEDMPSAHVVVQEILNKEVKYESNKYFGYPKEIIIKCCLYCKIQTKVSKKTSIIYTSISNISKGKEVGSVITKNTQSIKI